MTRPELKTVLDECMKNRYPVPKIMDAIWGQPFDGETERTLNKDGQETHAPKDSSLVACVNSGTGDSPRENCALWVFRQCKTNCIQSGNYP